MLELVGRLESAVVTVVGDAVLDEFVFGEIARVSREAPVLILAHRRTEWIPGGGANTASNLAALDVRTSIIGRVGKDEHGARLRELLAERGVACEGLEEDASYVTPTKSRVLAGSPHTTKQQIVRIDRGETASPLAAGSLRRLFDKTARARKKGHALIVADYGYGAVDPSWIASLPEGPGPITLDSRFALSRFRGVDAATPNLEELERALAHRIEDDDLVAIETGGTTLRRKLRAQALLVTRGSRGMTLLEPRRGPVSIPVFGSDEVADVTGAGDTVIAVFTAVRAAGGSWREAAELANVAGGLVVMKRGTATVTRGELEEALRDGRETGEG
jgi:rfaE bifunctional protein kinase chain/domain